MRIRVTWFHEWVRYELWAHLHCERALAQSLVRWKIAALATGWLFMVMVAVMIYAECK